MERKNKVIALFAIGMILALSGAVMYQQAQINEGQDYIQWLEEQLTNYEEVDNEIFATVYWLVNYEGSADFTLAHSGHNVITNAGRTALRGHIGDTAVAVWDYIAIGESSGGDATSTTLVSESFRAQGTYATVGSYNFTITYTWTAGTFAGETITEAGVLNAAASGTLLSYQDFTGITLQSGDSLQVQFMFQVGS